MKVLENLLLIKSIRVDVNCAGHSRKMRGESASSKTYSETSKHAGKRNKKYVDCPKDQ